jgi:hypothetical protein
MLRIRTALLLVLAAASMTLAAPVQPQFDEEELVAKLCGRLEQVDSVPDKVLPGRYSEKSHPLKDAKLVAYERHSNSECCAGAPVAAEIRSDKSGNFEFKGLPNGFYWLVARVELQDYRMAIRIGQLKDKQPVCSQMSFVIDAYGDFTLRVRAPGR